MNDTRVKGQKDEVGIQAIACSNGRVEAPLHTVRDAKRVAGNELVMAQDCIAQELRSPCVIIIAKLWGSPRCFLQKPYSRKLHRFRNSSRMHVDLSQRLIKCLETIRTPKNPKKP